ncbi:hypothetical protein PAMP_005442 [Pampus punctatissimus]
MDARGRRGEAEEEESCLSLLGLGSSSSYMLVNKPNTMNLLRPQSTSKSRRCNRISGLFVGCNLRRRSVNLNTSRQISL